jgi:hypothetical protein
VCYNPVTCQWDDQKIWTAEGRDKTDPGAEGGFCKDDRVWVHRLNGDTGVIEDTVELPFPCTTFGVYGGAVDSTNDLWLSRLFEGSPGAIRVDFDDLTYEEIGPVLRLRDHRRSQGQDLGRHGRPGALGPGRQDLDEDRGLDHECRRRPGRGPPGAHVGRHHRRHPGHRPRDHGARTDRHVRGEKTQCKGISVDVDGFIWAVPDNADRAYRVDPGDLTYEKIGGLVGAYTYSDMTGGTLKSVACNPPG